MTRKFAGLSDTRNPAAKTSDLRMPQDECFDRKPGIPHIAALLLVLGFTLLSACSTIQVHSDRDITPGPYAGTKQAMRKTTQYWHDYDFYGQVVLVALDVPLSLAADTLLLPYDAYPSGN